MSQIRQAFYILGEIITKHGFTEKQGLLATEIISEKPDFKRLIRVHQLQINGLAVPILTRPSVLQRTCDSCIKNPASKCEDGCLLVHPVFQSTDPTYSDSLLTFRLSHEDAIEADFEPAISWLMFCRDLQGMQMNNVSLPFEISITMNHAPPNIWAELGWTHTEMDLIEVYVKTQQNAANLSKWVASARRGEKGILHSTYDKMEDFTINLNKLDDPLPRKLPDSTWKEVLKWKWRWLGQRYMNTKVGQGFPDIVK